MAIEFRLTLGGDMPLEQIAALAAPEATEEPALPGYPRLFSADLYDQLGYAITILKGRNGYFDANDDNGKLWEWEPENYVDITFRMRFDGGGEMGVPNVMATVARILEARTEDAALILIGDLLLLTRFNGTIRKHNVDQWYEGTLDIIPG